MRVQFFSQLYPNFNASYSWLWRFLRRNNIVFRRVTSVGQIPLNYAKRLGRDEEHLHGYDFYVNMDEIPCYFEIPQSASIGFKSVETVKSRTAGYYKLRSTVFLSTGVTRHVPQLKALHLPSMIISRNFKKPLKGHFPPGMSSKGEIMTQPFMVEQYVSRIWCRWPGGYFKTVNTLTKMDSATSHLKAMICIKKD